MGFDYNLVVIGGGAAGLVSSYIGSGVLKAKVALIEKNLMGGDCLNTGCVPSKALIKSAKIIHQIQNCEKYGIKNASYDFEFSDIMERVHGTIEAIAPHDSIERYTGLGVECITGHAEIVDKHTVKVGDKILRTKNIILAHGAEPFIPPVKGLDQISYLTSENLWQLKSLPKRLVILGGGPIGTEMAQSFARLGSNVTQIEMGERILQREDPDIADVVIDQLKKDGVNLKTGLKADGILVENGEKLLECINSEGAKEKIPFDEILFAVGRKARSIGPNYAELGIRLRDNGTIDVDKYMRANGSNIYACGDITGPYQFTHMASHQAYFCVRNALFPFFKTPVDYSAVPWVTYSDPEIAQVGLNETEAKRRGIDYEVYTYGVDDLDRAITESEARGMVKVLTVPGKDKILGANIVSYNAGEMLTEFIFAMKHGMGLKKLMAVTHPYPTMSEANKFAAGIFAKGQMKPGIQNFLEKMMKYMR